MPFFTRQSIRQPSGSLKRWRGTAIVVALALTVSGTAAVQLSPGNSGEAVPAAAVPPRIGVSSLGTLEPKSRVIRLSAPTSSEGARVERLLVAEGEWVEANAVVAILDTSARRQAALIEAKAKVLIAEARLAQIKAGAKPGEIAAREAAQAYTEAELKNAEAELQRGEQLRLKQAMAKEEFDKRLHRRELAQHEVMRAQGLLASAREVRDVDVSQAQADLEFAIAALSRAQVDMETAQVRAPFTGQVLKVAARPGERVGDGGIIELGDTSEMDAVAEVYEADLLRLSVGQAARIRVPSLDVELSGHVINLGHRVGRKVVLDNDPVADTDARVVEVRIRLEPEDGQRVARLSNSRVHVVIDAQ